MKKTNFSIAADILFYAACAFLLSFCILRFYRVALALALICAVCLSLAVAGVSFLLLYGNNRKKLLGRRERERRDALMLHLALERPERTREQLFRALNADGRSVTLGDELCADGTPLLPFYSLEPLSADEMAKVIRKRGTQFSIACNRLTPEAEKLLGSFRIRTMDGDETYALFLRTQTMPDPLLCGEIPKQTARGKLRRSFAKSNARPFFFSGVLLLIMSLFTFFPLYYLITGSVLLCGSVAVRLFGYAAP